MGQISNRDRDHESRSLIPERLRVAQIADEYTSRLAPSPGLLGHPARPRTIARQTHRRRRVAPHPPARPAHRTHPGLRGRPRRPPRPGTDRAHLPGDGPRPRLRHPGRLADTVISSLAGSPCRWRATKSGTARRHPSISSSSQAMGGRKDRPRSLRKTAPQHPLDVLAQVGPQNSRAVQKPFRTGKMVRENGDGHTMIVGRNG
jgi:hypothetical protein